jgi:hypothetical protein
MSRKFVLTFILSVSLISAVLGALFTTPTKAQLAPEVYVKFPNGTGSSVNEYRVGDTFGIDIVVSSPDIGIWVWQVGIHFDKNFLECTAIPPSSYVSPFFAGKTTSSFMGGTIENDWGRVTFSGQSLLAPEATGVTGTGVLMWFEFRVVGYGSCVLDLTLSPPDLRCGTKLIERVGDDVVPISPIVLYDGSFDNRGLEPVGGILIPVDKLGLLAPYIGLTSTIVVAAAATAIYVKRVGRRKEKR